MLHRNAISISKYIRGKFVERGTHITYIKYFHDWLFLSRPLCMRKTFLFNPVYINVTINVLSMSGGVLSRLRHRYSAKKFTMHYWLISNIVCFADKVPCISEILMYVNLMISDAIWRQRSWTLLVDVVARPLFGAEMLHVCWPRPLQWRHSGLDGVSNHQPHDC